MGRLDSFKEKAELIQSVRDNEVPEILLNFFIKLAMSNCYDKEDKDIIKRSLYLLKKIFIIWPNTKIKLETIKKMCENITKIDNLQIDRKLDKLKFNYTLLTILNILTEFEKKSNVTPLLFSLYYLLLTLDPAQPGPDLQSAARAPPEQLLLRHRRQPLLDQAGHQPHQEAPLNRLRSAQARPQVQAVSGQRL